MQQGNLLKVYCFHVFSPKRNYRKLCSRVWKTLHLFPCMRKVLVCWEKRVCIGTDTLTCADSEVQLRAWLSIVTSFPHF